MLRFYNNDFNPYGQRVWISLLEKEIPYEHVEINLFNRPQSFTSVVPNRILPTLLYEGEVLQESVDLCLFVDEVAPQNPLWPASARDKYVARSLIRRFGDPAFALVHDVLLAQTKEDQSAKASTLLEFVRAIGEALGKGGGPFFFGNTFSIPDIVLFPMLERMFVLLPHYRGFELPPEKPFDAIRRFYDAAIKRPSVACTTAPRTKSSLRTHPFDEIERAQYLISASRGYASNNIPEVRAELAQKKPPLAD